MATTRVNQYSTVITANPANSITLPFTPTNGNALICVVYDLTGNTNLLSITQTGATWVMDVQSPFNQPVNIAHGYIFHAFAVSGAGTTVTFTCDSGPSQIGIIVMEYNSTLGTINIVDQTASNNGTSDTADSGITAITTRPDEIWVGGLGALLASIPSGFNAPSNGFTLIDQVYGDSINNANPVAAYEKIVTAQNTANTSATITGGVSAWGGVMVTYAPTIPPACPVFITAGDYINELRNRFAEIAFATWITDTDLIRWINLGLDDIVFRTLPPRHEAAPFVFTGTIAGYNYPLPADFFRMKQFGDSGGMYVFNPLVGTSFNVILEEDRTDDLEEDLALSGTGNRNIPENFWFWNKKLYVYPIQDIVYTFKMYYYRLPIYVCLLTDAVDLDRPYVEVLTKFVLWKALEKDKHPQGQIYHQEYEQALSTMYSESRIKVEKRARYVHSHNFYGGDGR